MQGKHLYEYAVIRAVPRVEREEFLNIGLLVYCHAQRFLQCRFTLPEDKLRMLFSGVDIDVYQRYLEVFNRICKGDTTAGPIARLPARERFRWLTATRSSILQCSRPHTGFCVTPGDEFDRLYNLLVL
jgi:hypothetical protein